MRGKLPACRAHAQFTMAQSLRGRIKNCWSVEECFDAAMPSNVSAIQARRADTSSAGSREAPVCLDRITRKASTANSESQMMSNSFRNICSILYQGAVTDGQFSAQRRDCRGWTGDFFAVLVCMLQNAAGAAQSTIHPVDLPLFRRQMLFTTFF